MPLSDPIKVAKKATDLLEKENIPYLVGGSLASSLYGIPRLTQDIDIVAELSETGLKKIIPVLSDAFYVDEAMALDAIRRGKSFNIIDKEFLFKVDVFISGKDDLSIEEMRRRVRHTIADSGSQTMYLCSPEDIIAHKLYWFKLGDGVSERQWNDAVNVIKVQGNRLDHEYLKQICAARGVLNLLQKALA
jgi:hypothetical protein